MTGPAARRPIGARASGWAQGLAARLASARVAPNTISAASVWLAALAGLCLWGAGGTDGWFGRTVLLLLAGAAVGARLLANLLDGMVAVEHGAGTRDGGLWNEVPDRLADVLVLVGAGAGVAASGAGPDWLGWLAATGALLTAYVREIAARLGAPMDFGGPMAKPHRMAVIIAGCGLGILEALVRDGMGLMALGLWLVAILSFVTAGLRLQRARTFLQARAGAPAPAEPPPGGGP